MQKEAVTVNNILSLASVLDRIESVKPKDTPADSTAPSSSSVSTLLEISKTQEIHWYEYIDPNTGKSYYHNFNTGETAWEKPEQFNPYLPSTSSAKQQNYSSGAFFNQGDGRFTVSGTTNYWEQVSLGLYEFVGLIIDNFFTFLTARKTK